MLLLRRSLLQGIGAVLAAPAIVRASSIMPVKTPKIIRPEPEHLAILDGNGNVVWRSGLGRALGGVTSPLKTDLLTTMATAVAEVKTLPEGLYFSASKTAIARFDKEMEKSAPYAQHQRDQRFFRGLPVMNGRMA